MRLILFMFLISYITNTTCTLYDDNSGSGDSGMSTSTSTSTTSTLYDDNSGGGDAITTITPIITTIQPIIDNKTDTKKIYIPTIMISITLLVSIIVFIFNKTKRKKRFITQKILIDGIMNDVTYV